MAAPLLQLHLHPSLSPAQTQPLQPLPQVLPCIDSSIIFKSYQGKAPINPDGNCSGTVQACRTASLPGRLVAFVSNKVCSCVDSFCFLLLKCLSSWGQRLLLSHRRAPSSIKEKKKPTIYFETAVQLGEFIILD